MKLKKIATVCCISMMAFIMTACGDESKKEKDTKEFSNIFGEAWIEIDKTTEASGERETATRPSEEETTKKPAEKETTKKPVEKETTTESEVETTTKFTPGDKPYEGIVETVLINKDGVKVTATELEYNSYLVELHLDIENNTDETIHIESGSLIEKGNVINGYVTSEGSLYDDIDAGEKLSRDISFHTDELKLYNINSLKDIAEMILYFEVKYEEDDETIYEGEVKLTTGTVEDYDSSKNGYMDAVNNDVFDELGYTVKYISDRGIYNKDGVSIASVAIVEDENGIGKIFLEVINDSSEAIYGLAGRMVLDGIYTPSHNFVPQRVQPGMKYIYELDLADIAGYVDYKELVGLDKIGEYSFTYVVSDNEYPNLSEGEIITINVDEKDIATDINGTELLNEKGIKISYKGYVEQKDYSGEFDGIYCVLVVENTSGQAVNLSYKYGSTKVNGTELSVFVDYAYIPDGETSLFTAELSEYYLSKLDIKSASEVKSFEFVVEVDSEDYTTNDEYTINVNFQ